MKSNKIIKIIISLIAFMVMSCLCGNCLGAVEGKYEYQRKDKATQQKKYMAKLKGDKIKVEMAIKTTKTLINKSRTRPYLPELYLRLAELYIEKSRIVYFLRRASASGSSIKSLDQLESNSLKNQAVETYQRILNNFPDYMDQDKVHFFMAHEYRELGQLDDMIVQYRALLQNCPKSTYISEVHLLLGDYFFNVKQDLEMAQRHYEIVTRFPKSAAIAIARYKLAWCHINKLEFKKAIKLLEESVNSVSSKDIDIDTYKRVDIRLESLVDMAYCYIESYKSKKPEEALTYFKKYAWSRPVYATVLEKLAYRYFIKKKWSHAAIIYRQLSQLSHDTEKLLEYYRNIFECVREQGSFKDTERDMAFIVKALEQQKYSVHITDAVKEKNLKDYELIARDIVTHLHYKARKEKSVEDFFRAAESYRLYLDCFSNSPVQDDMENNYAETLFSAENYIESGKQYEKLSANIPPKNSQKKQKLYSAVLSYYSALKHKKGLNHYQVVFARDGLKTAGKEYIKNFPKSRKVPEIKFNIAWITYDEGKHDEAIKQFSLFVKNYPKGKEAKAAIHLVLDSYHLQEDYEGLINYGQAILKNSLIDKKLRAEVAAIVNASEAKIISSLTVAALDDWSKGKSGLEEYAEQNKSSSMGEQALTALLVSGKDRGDLETIYKAGTKLVSNYPKSDQMESTLGVMIDTSLNISQFRLVTSYLEDFARKFPKHANTPEFLSQAANIRQNLGQYTSAQKNYQRILNSSTKKVFSNDQLVFTMASNAVKQNLLDYAIGTLVKNRKKLSKAGRIKANALTANLYYQKGNFKESARYRKKACQAYRPKYAKNDSQLNAAMAEMVFNSLKQSRQTYLNLQLKGAIDNKVVAAKSKLLQKLEKGYNEVLQYKSPNWALAACFNSHVINNEFSRFLKKAPMPAGLSPDQQKQYQQIISQKAQSYDKKADTYLKTCIKQAHKWEICDPQSVKYYLTTDSKNTKSGFFAKPNSSTAIGAQFLQDQELTALHQKLLKDSKNIIILNDLSLAYLKRKDYRQTILIAHKMLEQEKNFKLPFKSKIYNMIGFAYLNVSEDAMAKEMFEKALEISLNNIGAKLNLAGLLLHYGHNNKAARLYKTVEAATIDSDPTILLHQQAREYYHEYQKNKKS